MINQVRTLFLNRNGTPKALTTMPGEEFVDPNFIAKILPNYLRGSMGVLFGSNPDRAYLNYRLREIMQLLHSTDLEQHILDFDNRITYYPFDNDEFLDEVFVTTQDIVSGTNDLIITGEHIADSGAGTIRLQWNVLVESMEEIKVTRRTPPISTTSIPYDATAGRTGQIKLPGSGLSFEILQPVIGEEWEVYSSGRPDIGLETLLPNFAATIGPVAILDLFGLSPVEPILTYRNLWLENAIFASKYAGLLLAIATVLDNAPQVIQNA